MFFIDFFDSKCYRVRIDTELRRDRRLRDSRDTIPDESDILYRFF